MCALSALSVVEWHKELLSNILSSSMHYLGLDAARAEQRHLQSAIRLTGTGRPALVIIRFQGKAN